MLFRSKGGAARRPAFFMASQHGGATSPMTRADKQRLTNYRFVPRNGIAIFMRSGCDDLASMVTLQYHLFIAGEGSIRSEVPEGFETDLDSIPWYVSWLFVLLDPGGRRKRGCLHHDVQYQLQRLDRGMCDAILRTILLEDFKGYSAQVSVFGRRLRVPCYVIAWLLVQTIYVGVRLFGWLAWRENRKRLVEFRTQYYAQLKTSKEVFNPRVALT